jgi:hypothetical protein
VSGFSCQQPELRDCEFRNLGIIGILSIKFTDIRIPQFLNPLIPK